MVGVECRGWKSGDKTLGIRISLHFTSNLPWIDLYTKFHQNWIKIAKVSILGWMGWVGVVLGGCDGWIFIYHFFCLIFLCPNKKFQPSSSLRWILDAFCNFPWKTQNTPLQAYFSKKLWAEFFYFHFFCKTHGPPRLFSHFLETGCLQNLYPPNFYQGVYIYDTGFGYDSLWWS